MPWERLKVQSALLNLFSDSLPLPVFFIPAEDPATWHALAPVPEGLHPLHFILYYGRQSEKVRSNTLDFASARRRRRAVVGSFAGMHDCVVPVLVQGNLAGWMFCGSFLTRFPSPAALELQWGRLRRGRAPRQEFLEYCRVMLQAPLISTQAVGRLGRLLQALGQFVIAGTEPETLLKILGRARDTFARESPWRMWHYAAARRERLFQGPSQGAELATWDAEDFRLDKAPSAAIAFAASSPGTDEAGSLVDAARLQWACFHAARELGGMVAGRLGFDGALMLAPGNASAAKALALRILPMMERKLGMRLAAGYAASDPGSLDGSIRQAEFALQLALHQGKRLCGEAAGPLVRLGLGTLAREAASVAASHPSQLPRLRSQISEAALAQSQGRPELLRLHLRWALEPALARLKDYPLPELEARFEAARTAHELCLAFESSLEDLALRLRAPAKADRRSRLRGAAARMDQSFQESLSLKELAAGAGFSQSRFSRLFKRESGEGFGERMRRLRLEKARQLLQGSDLSVGLIAAECGYASASYFIRAFKAAEGLSPGRYRSNKLKLI
jgi:AraC-like DNA-binding protein